MTTQTKRKPIKTLRDGALKASIWLNEYEDRVFYTVTFARSYKKSDGDFADAYNYSGSDLLRLAHLTKLAHERIREMGVIDRQLDQMRDEMNEKETAGAA